MKNLLIAIVMLYVGVASAQAVPELRYNNNEYQIVAGELLNIVNDYDEGYRSGVAAGGGTNNLVHMNFVTNPAMSIYHNNGTYELLFEYEVDVRGASKLYDSNGTTAAFVYIEFLNRINHGSSSDGQWHRPVFRLVFAYEYQFGNAVQGPDIIATSYTGGVNSLPNFVRDLLTPATRATHARITIQHQTGVRLNRIIEITLPQS